MTDAKKVYDKSAEIGDKMDELVKTCIDSNVYGLNMERKFTSEDGKEYDVIITIDLYKHSEGALRHRPYSGRYKWGD